jgi:uncharacterized protein YejL (UPF0352 family)
MDEEAVVTTVDCVIRKVKAVVTTTIAVLMNTEAVVTTTIAVVITALVVIMVVSARCQMVTADEKFYNALLSSIYVSNLV